jgi:hypothetical protein
VVDWCYLVIEEATHFQFFISVTPWTETVPSRYCYFRTFVWISTNFKHCPLQAYHSQASLSQVLCKMGSENAHRCAQNAENRFGFDFFTVIPQRWRWISQSHH